jgi:hypothetical protein
MSKKVLRVQYLSCFVLFVIIDLPLICSYVLPKVATALGELGKANEVIIDALLLAIKEFKHNLYGENN